MWAIITKYYFLVFSTLGIIGVLSIAGQYWCTHTYPLCHVMTYHRQVVLVFHVDGKRVG